MITLIVVLFTLIFILGSVSPLFVTDDTHDLVMMEQ